MRGIITLGEFHRLRVQAVRDELDAELSLPVVDFGRVQKLERALALLAVTDNVLAQVRQKTLDRFRLSLAYGT